MVTRLPNTNSGAANRSQAGWNPNRQATGRADQAVAAGDRETESQQGAQRPATAATGHQADRPQQQATRRNRGLQWVEAQRASGRYDAEVHRSPVGADLLKGLLQLAAH